MKRLVVLRRFVMNLNQEKTRDELLKILAAEKPSIGIRLLSDSKILDEVLPEISIMKGMAQNPGHHHKDVFEHTLLVVDKMASFTADPILRLAALLHDVGKPVTYKVMPDKGVTFYYHEPVGAKMAVEIMTRLKFSNEEIELVYKLVRDHLRLPMLDKNGDLTDKGIRKAYREMEGHFEALILLCRADMTSHDPVKIANRVANFNTLIERIRAVIAVEPVEEAKPPIDGHDLIAMGIKPSKQMGMILQMLKDKVTDGELAPSDRDGAFKIVQEFLSNNNQAESV